MPLTSEITGSYKADTEGWVAISGAGKCLVQKSGVKSSDIVWGIGVTGTAPTHGYESVSNEVKGYTMEGTNVFYLYVKPGEVYAITAENPLV